jgi:CheY-like chemotaxis protein
MRRTILLADDSPTIQRLVTNTFADGDYDIVSVSNGEAAIRKFDEIEPDVVLADIYMPGKNGYEVCGYVRQHSRLGDTPVVLLVGAFDAFDEEKAKEAGATSNITKPFEPQALVSLVESVLPDSQNVNRVPVKAAPVEARAVEDPVPAPHEPVSVVSEPAPAPPPAIYTYDELTPAVVEMAAPQPPSPPPPAPPQPPEIEVHDDDLLGLENLFAEPTPTPSFVLSDQDIDRIADRVIQRISPQVIESLAWEIVPDLTERIVREELQRKR